MHILLATTLFLTAVSAIDTGMLTGGSSSNTVSTNDATLDVHSNKQPQTFDSIASDRLVSAVTPEDSKIGSTTVETSDSAIDRMLDALSPSDTAAGSGLSIADPGQANAPQLLNDVTPAASPHVLYPPSIVHPTPLHAQAVNPVQQANPNPIQPPAPQAAQAPVPPAVQPEMPVSAPSAAASPPLVEPLPNLQVSPTISFTPSPVPPGFTSTPGTAFVTTVTETVYHTSFSTSNTVARSPTASPTPPSFSEGVKLQYSFVAIMFTAAVFSYLLL